MAITGFIKTTLRDWEGKTACRVDLKGENIGAYSVDPLVLSSAMTMNEILDYIDGKMDFLDGVVIAGGETCNDPDLYPLLKELRKRKIPVRLNTYGHHPDILDDLIGALYVKSVCLDVPASPKSEYYKIMTGYEPDFLKNSIKILEDSGIETVVRTVAIPGILNEDTVCDIAKQFGFSKQLIIVQFDPSKSNNENLKKLKPYSASELKELVKNAKRFVKNVSVREL